MNVHISLDQYNELTGVHGVRGGANKNVNKELRIPDIKNIKDVKYSHLN
jgi:hypothetical protein